MFRMLAYNEVLSRAAEHACADDKPPSLSDPTHFDKYTDILAQQKA
jgi:hypothetical protein